ncbi:hypothetical protein DSO57_1003741 [Entomophthora muscae]|uniref:Uncharacterized protein n=1 Tax=Entomophthora muscae TaxID=34485 RepID=A0ACC2SXH1_9FUNG|nr:hypothetical protein DSO57_1003741 [Entomophthora muscae]
MPRGKISHLPIKRLGLRRELNYVVTNNFLKNLNRAFQANSVLTLDQSASSIFGQPVGCKEVAKNKALDRASWDLYEPSIKAMIQSLIDSRQAKDKNLSTENLSKVLRLCIGIKKSPNNLAKKNIESDILTLCQGDARILYQYCVLAFMLSQRLEHGINDVLLLLNICIKYGAVEAEFTKASILFEGIQGIQDKGQGQALMKKLADKGLLVAITKYGSMLLNHGEINEAIGYLKKAAKHGSVEACLILGHVYNSDKYIKKDVNEALGLFEMAAKKGSHEAHFYIGLIKQEAENADINTVISHYEKAAASGIAEAQYNLGLIHFSGKGTPKNYILAMEYWEMASNQKFPLAMVTTFQKQS